MKQEHMICSGRKLMQDALEHALRQKKVVDSMTPHYIVLEDNQTFIQQKRQGKRRVY